jgi:predicted O-methyltransferase YrrM
MTPSEPKTREDTDALAAYNHHLSGDLRFHTVWLPVGDGLSISTKVSAS